MNLNISDQKIGGSALNTLIILLDGAADENIPELGDLTPLESFKKPFMDSIASNGLLGWTDGREYTHLFLLEFLTGNNLNVSRGLVEAAGMGVPIEPGRVAYRFSPAYIDDSGISWAYRVTPEVSSSLQSTILSNLDILDDLSPRIYFYDEEFGDGRGVMTVEAEEVIQFPMPPAPVRDSYLPENSIRKFIHKVASDMNGLTIIPWGGGSLTRLEEDITIPEIRDLVMISKSPSALGVGGLLNIRRDKVDNMWNGFQESLRLLENGNVLMHVEETDEISHRCVPEQKVGMLREIDELLIENFGRLVGHRVAFIIDHGTSSISGQHISMRVPFAVSEVINSSEPTVRFCENNLQYVSLDKLAKTILTYPSSSNSV